MAAKGGGAWKVAYADFVTAMMAFFLVMWICGQDQKVKRAVSYYFQDPIGADHIGTSHKPHHQGSLTDYSATGSVPHSESVAMGRGRKSYGPEEESGRLTKQVNDWLHEDKTAQEYWHRQAQEQRQRAALLKEPHDTDEVVARIAMRLLARQLRDELTQDVSQEANRLYQGLLLDSFSAVRWTELAEDLLAN
jgi:flagellar motor protein MotB